MCDQRKELPPIKHKILEGEEVSVIWEIFARILFSREA